VKIAITCVYLPSGSKIGVGYQVHALANALVRRGHDVTVFSQTGPSDDSLYEVSVVRPRRRLRTFGFAWDLRKIDFNSFDVLNAHGDDWFLWGCRRPRHVHTFHGSCFAEMLHIKGITQRLRMGALAVCEYNSLMLPDETVAVSENTRRYIPFIGHVIPCGVDTGAFHPGEKSPRPAILFVGTMHGRKRGGMLLDVFRNTIRPKIPAAELWCVCDRPAGESDDANVKWLGRINQDALTDLYRRAWVFCLPSTYEGFGVPYIEAMASGTAVVATRNVGALEVTAHGNFGVICADDRLGDELLTLLNDSTRRSQLEQLGLQHSADFSWESVTKRYEELYAGNAPVARITQGAAP